MTELVSRRTVPSELERNDGDFRDELIPVPSRIAPAGRFHEPRSLTAEERERYRAGALESRLAKQAALRGDGPQPLHPINLPLLDPIDLMPQRQRVDIGGLSLFSGGGGLDLGFDRAGVTHLASFEILADAASTIKAARPEWQVFGGESGDVTKLRWADWRHADLVHGGPPCQPFSAAGRQRGADDERNMWPAFVQCIRSTRPRAFVGENVPALGSKKFAPYVQQEIIEPLSARYEIFKFVLRGEDFGVPQTRRRVFFVGFSRRRDAQRFEIPQPTHYWRSGAPEFNNPDSTLERCFGMREALGLPEIGYDALTPTIRSTLTGPRHTTSIVNSVAAHRIFERLHIWPNGVAPDRQAARAFVAKNGHFRLSVPDVALLQGFPEDWGFTGATYMRLGQIGNAVPPPIGYAVASAVIEAIT